MQTIISQAFARAGLIGNPSDGYFGKTISIILRNFHAQATLTPSPKLAILPQRPDRLEYANLSELTSDIQTYGYYGGVRLIKAALKRFFDYCQKQQIPLPAQNFTLDYQTNIPVRVGLAGSSAIVTAVMRGLMQFYQVEIPQPILPGIILSVELDELGIGAGLQDRVAQVYQGAVYMDFAQDRMQRDGHGLYQPIDPALLPPLYLAYHDNLAEGTEVTHNNLRARYNNGDPEVRAAITQWASYTQQAYNLICAGQGEKIGPLMNANFDLRAQLIKISPGNTKLIQTGRQLGASTNFAGSGGAIIGLYDGSPQMLQKLTTAYAEFGAKVLLPQITEDSPK